MEKATITIELSKDEALVLFEWLASHEEGRSGGEAVDAQTYVFWSIEAQWERELVEPFDPRYLMLVKAAQQRILSKR